MAHSRASRGVRRAQDFNRNFIFWDQLSQVYNVGMQGFSVLEHGVCLLVIVRELSPHGPIAINELGEIIEKSQGVNQLRAKP
jgi:hypothetical protein